MLQTTINVCTFKVSLWVQKCGKQLIPHKAKPETVSGNLLRHDIMKAFVIMPFSNEFDDTFQIGIKDPAKKLDVNAYRLDEELFDQGMLDKIYSEIEDCDFVIADLSNKNANVFYELGYAHAKEKLCILITKDSENIPFDLKHKRHIVYGNSLKYLVEQIEKNIVWAKDEIIKKKNNPFKIDLKASGDLVNSSQESRANIEFKLDIENISNKVAPEIHSIYLYTANLWTLKKDGKTLLYKQSDIKPYSFKYQFMPDMTKIPKKGWTQIKLQLSRIVAKKWKNQELKNNYTINGDLFVQLATAT